MGEVVLEIPARPEYLVVARQVVAAAASVEPTFRDERIDDLRIAVSEATTNAIEAHTDASSTDRVKIRCDLGDDRIEVEVLDHGGGFDPDDVDTPPDVDHPERLEWERGLGIPLMRQFADETEIRPSAAVLRCAWWSIARRTVRAPAARKRGTDDRLDRRTSETRCTAGVARRHD